jgi:sugar transferase (PEP-CTERM system associated)
MLRLFSKYYPIRNLLFFLGESTLLFSSIWLVIFLLNSGEISHDPEKLNTWARILLVVFTIQVSLYYHDLYNFRYKSRMFELSVRIVSSIGVACLFLAALYYFFPFLILEQGIFFIGIFIVLLFLVSWRLLYQVGSEKKIWDENVLLVGDGKLAKMVGDEIQHNMDSGYTICAVFSNPGNSALADEWNVEKINSFDKLCEYALTNKIKKIIVALDEKRGHSPVKQLLNCKMQGIKIFDGVSFYEHMTGKILASNTPPSWLVFSDGFSRSFISSLCKRTGDIVFSLAGIILSAPLQLGAVILIKATSPGPIFYRQTRVGQMGKRFQVIKFRTMLQDAEAQSGAVWASQDDHRITSIGRVLRKFRLDELPQFWNVLKGEMSFIGPRPERPEFVEQLKEKLPYYGERHTVKPGITGWAQVNYHYGASEEDALRKLEYDLFYIKHLSLFFDLYIVLKTAKIVLVGDGAR